MRSHTPTLLIVDDEAPILSALRRCLRREGYRILTANSPGDALQALDEHTIDAVLTDHKMPGMDGLELLAEVRKRQPDAVRLLISGWSEEIPPTTLKALGVRSLLPKPWEDAELKRVLRAALGAGRGAGAASSRSSSHHGVA